MTEYEQAKLHHGYISNKSIICTDKGYYLLDRLFFEIDHFHMAKFNHKGHLCSPEAFNQATTRFKEPVVQD